MLNITAPVNFTSYGICSTEIMRELYKQKENFCWFSIGRVECTKNDELLFNVLREHTLDYKSDSNSLKIFHQFDVTHHPSKGKHIAYVIFEKNVLNRYEINQLQQQDCVLVPSKWAKRVCEANDINNCYVVPLGTHPVSHPANMQGGPTIFIHIGKPEYRKGHDVLPKIWERAFGNDPSVELLFFCNTFFPNEDDYNNYIRPMEQFSNVEIIKKWISEPDLRTAMEQSHCGIFPTRAEGWCMPILELMNLGKHIITTDYSGHTEFVNNQNSLIVSASSVEIAKDNRWFNGEGTWLSFTSKDIDNFAEQLRFIHDLNQKGNLTINQAGFETAQKYTWENTVNKLKEHL